MLPRPDIQLVNGLDRVIEAVEQGSEVEFESSVISNGPIMDHGHFEHSIVENTPDADHDQAEDRDEVQSDDIRVPHAPAANDSDQADLVSNAPIANSSESAINDMANDLVEDIHLEGSTTGRLPAVETAEAQNAHSVDDALGAFVDPGGLSLENPLIKNILRKIRHSFRRNEKIAPSRMRRTLFGSVERPSAAVLNVILEFFVETRKLYRLTSQQSGQVSYYYL